MKIEKLVKDAILNQEEYFIEEAPWRVKLDANENPYALPEDLGKEMEQCIREVSLNRYPDPGSRLLKRRLAETLDVDEEMLLIGNGSDELIHLLLLAFRSDPAGGVVIPVPTFAMYKISAVNAGHYLIEVPLNDRFDLDGDAMEAAMARFDPDLVFLSYPNNPTGNLFTGDTMERLISRSRGLVVVDEAYYHFAQRSFLPDLRRWEHLVILRTLSKVGFAALRLGMLIAHPAVVRELDKVRLPYNVNALSQAVGLFVLDHEPVFHRQVRQIIDDREKLFKALQGLDGITPYRSDANFILFSCAFRKNAIYESLIEKGIVIKNFSSPGPLRGCMRVTVGREEENQEFLSALRDALRQ
jgi:histidinol-phosphate aminotransferase